MIRLIRDKEVYPEGPWTATVPPEEVDNYRKGGWIPDPDQEPEAEPTKPRRTRRTAQEVD